MRQYKSKDFNLATSIRPASTGSMVLSVFTKQRKSRPIKESIRRHCFLLVLTIFLVLFVHEPRAKISKEKWWAFSLLHQSNIRLWIREKFVLRRRDAFVCTSLHRKNLLHPELYEARSTWVICDCTYESHACAEGEWQNMLASCIQMVSDNMQYVRTSRVRKLMIKWGSMVFMNLLSMDIEWQNKNS